MTVLLELEKLVFYQTKVCGFTEIHNYLLPLDTQFIFVQTLLMRFLCINS
jgi:hypothetical protein